MKPRTLSIPFLCILGFVFTASAQDYSQKSLKENDSNKEKIYHFEYSFGIGYSPLDETIFHLVHNNYLEFHNPYDYHFTPVFAAAIDYTPNKSHSSFGIAGSYQSMIDKPFQYFGSDWERIQRYNIVFRFLHAIGHYATYTDSRFYYGFRFGICVWHDVVPSGYNQYQTYVDPSQVIWPSFQFVLGARLYLGDAVAINIEIGLGSPYIAYGGFTVK